MAARPATPGAPTPEGRQRGGELKEGREEEAREESGLDLIRRARKPALKLASRFLPAVDDALAREAGGVHVLEICGPAQSLKTETALRICANSSGKSAFIDLDGRMSAERAISVFQSQGSSLAGAAILRPRDPVEAVRCVHDAAVAGAAVVVLDSLLAMHWMWALTDPDAAGLPVSFPAMLFKLRKKFGFVLIAVKPETLEDVGKKSYTSRTWNNGVTHRLYLANNINLDSGVSNLVGNLVRVIDGHNVII